MVDAMRYKLLAPTALLMSLGCCYAQQPSGRISWPQTKEYELRVRSLSLSPEKAHALLTSKTRQHPDPYFDRAPLFLLGDEYFFGVPNKTKIPIQGFYVNGVTGTIEYRTSKLFVDREDDVLPADAFISRAAID